MPLSSYCRNCGGSKNPNEYALNHCGACENLGNEAVQHAAATDPELTPDQLLYVKRMAMSQRAMHPGRNYTDPRKFSGANGMIPIPPQTNRGSTEQ